jgi:hypothetical protein
MPDQPSVDDLRARLRQLGYLDAGVDRFVLGPVRRGRSLSSLAWRSSARIGLLAALLLGPSTAAALGGRLPGLVTGPRDAVVLALYLGVLFGVAVAAAAFAAALALGAAASRIGERAGLAARARMLSGAAGALVATACLVYLVFWWRTVSPIGASSYRVAWTWLVLAIAVGVSLFLGHAVRVTTLALTASRSGDESLFPRRAPGRRRVAFGVGAAALAAAAGLLFLAAPDVAGPGQAARRTPIEAAPTGVRLTVIAIDGLDAQYLDRLVRAGRLPAFERLLSGAQATLPASDAPDPARTWTSLATGQPAAVHGVSGIETRRVSGIQGTVAAGPSGLGATIAAATDVLRLTRPALTTSEQRRSKTFWEVAADAGLSTVIVNWWATWPVPEGRGIVLSDRATLRLDRGGALDAEIAPPSLYASLRPQWAEWRDQARRDIVAVFPDRDDPTEAVLRRAAEQDVLPARLAERLGANAPRLEAVYLPGLDIAQFALLGAGAGLPPSVIAARVEALERYYQFLDGVVSRLVVAAGADGLVALVGDAGRSASRGATLVALSGPAARAGARIQASRDDVMPTLLYVLGVPASRQLSGRPRRELLTEGFAARTPLREVDDYGPRTLAPRPPNATPLDQEMLDRLRSLGYVR